MPFAAKASFRISQVQLDFDTARKIYYSKELWHRGYSGANISDSPPGRSHYWIEQGYERNPLTDVNADCMRLKMYNTYIHTWWEDGTYQSRYWDSAITRDVLSAFGPVRVWSDSRTPFTCRPRFGLWYEPGKQFPYHDGITVDPDGFVRKVTDHKYVMKSDAKKQRTAIRNRFRLNTLARILLGEFSPDFFAKYQTNVKKSFGRWDTGWMAQVPPVHSKIASCFYNNEEHEVLRQKIAECYSWRDGPVRDNREAAVAAAVEVMATELLESIGGWREKVAVEYGDVNVKELR